jgi:MFS family permease
MARQRNWVLGIVNVSHTFNHLVTGMYPVLLALMMAPLGFGYTELGLLQAIHNFVSNALQASYGFVTQYFKRAVILGTGNIVFGVATSLTGFAQASPQVVACKSLSGVGSSPQHVVGATMLSTWFEGARGRMLALHNTAGSVGTLIGPLLAITLLQFMDWRAVFFIIGIPSVIVGLSYFLLRERVHEAPITSNRRFARAGWQAYAACFRNRELMLVSLLMMVGAAGRAGGINETYLLPHFMYDLGIAAAAAGTLYTIVQAGGLVAPLAWGWISDIFSRKLVMQAALVLSAVTTLWLGQQTALDVFLIANLALHGLVVHARGAITQAMVGDYAGPELQDAASTTRSV